MRLCRGGTGYTGEGYADGGEPSAEYLQAQLAIESIWLDLEKYMKQVATAISLPYSALELEYQDAVVGNRPDHQGRAPAHPGARSGGRSTSSPSWAWPATILTACGSHYGHADLVEQAEAASICCWPGRSPASRSPGPTATSPTSGRCGAASRAGSGSAWSGTG